MLCFFDFDFALVRFDLLPPRVFFDFEPPPHEGGGGGQQQFQLPAP